MKNALLKHAGTIISFFIIIHSSSFSQEKTSPNQNEELGQVSWYRDYDVSITHAKQQNKKILILFQEVPGCLTCKNYGQNVLSHPLMVEIIENEFIPLVIYNNKAGKDREILNLFNEPSWNNPVVRIVDENGKNVVQRISGNYSSTALYNAMKISLINDKKMIPEYMKLLGEELVSYNNSNIKEKYYKMLCFWNGESQLGQLNGVLSTEPGFINGFEVVKVKYNENVIDKDQLNKFALQNKITPMLKTDTYKIAYNDRQYYLQHNNYKYLPLTELQKTKINSALGRQQPAKKYLSPKQKLWLNELENPNTKREILFDKDFFNAWKNKTKGN